MMMEGRVKYVMLTDGYSVWLEDNSVRYHNPAKSVSLRRYSTWLNLAMFSRSKC
jgi:hypothetical protein